MDICALTLKTGSAKQKQNNIECSCKMSPYPIHIINVQKNPHFTTFILNQYKQNYNII